MLELLVKFYGAYCVQIILNFSWDDSDDFTPHACFLIHGFAALFWLYDIGKNGFDARFKEKKIKTIAVIGVSEPDNYVLYPGQLTGGSALYAFGALGGLILGSIEASRIEKTTNQFTASVKGTRPGLTQHWNESLSMLLQSKGYQVTQLPPLPNKAGKNEVDCASTVGKFDAVLLSTISMTGYVVESMVEPRVIASVRLLSNNCAETIFSDGYIYSAKSLGKLTHITSDAELSFPSQEALLADPQKARRAMRTGLSEIAKTATSEF